MAVNPLDHPGQVFDLALLNPNPSSSKTKDGPVYRVSFEVERDTWDLFMDADTKGLMIAAKAAVVAEEAPEALERPEKGPYGEQARQIKLHGFFRAPDVWRALGSDSDYLDWLKGCQCAYGIQDRGAKLDECGGDIVPAHVRRVANGAGTGIKPEFSAIPLCDTHHQIQHARGEGDLGGREWFDKMRVKYVEQWAWERAKQVFGIESMTWLNPATLIQWAVDNSVDNYLPVGYGE